MCTLGATLVPPLDRQRACAIPFAGRFGTATRTSVSRRNGGAASRAGLSRGRPTTKTMRTKTKLPDMTVPGRPRAVRGNRMFMRLPITPDPSYSRNSVAAHRTATSRRFLGRN
jgi:hypothetical protein